MISCDFRFLFHCLLRVFFSFSRPRAITTTTASTNANLFLSHSYSHLQWQTFYTVLLLKKCIFFASAIFLNWTEQNRTVTFVPDWHILCGINTFIRAVFFQFSLSLFLRFLFFSFVQTFTFTKHGKSSPVQLCRRFSAIALSNVFTFNKNQTRSK